MHLLRRISGLALLVALLAGSAGGAAPREGHQAAVHGAAFSPGGRMLATCGADQKICLWEVPTLRRIGVLSRHQDVVSSVAFRADGRVLATGSYDGTARLWDARTGRGQASFGPHPDYVLSVSLSPDGGLLAAGTYGGSTVVWDREGRRVATVAGHAAAISPDGSLLATAGAAGRLALHRLPGGEEVASWTGHGATPNAVSFSSDGQMLASCAQEVKVWNVATRALVREAAPSLGSPLVSLAWSPDGRRLAVGSFLAGGVLWEGGKTLPLRAGGPVQAVAFSPDGRYLALGDHRGSVELWETSTGKVVARREGGVKVPTIGK